MTELSGNIANIFLLTYSLSSALMTSHRRHSVCLSWRGRGPRPEKHCVNVDPALPPQIGGTSAPRPMYCGQTAAGIKMPLGTEVGLGPGHIMLDGDPFPLLLQKGTNPPILVHVCSVVAKRLDGAKRLNGSKWHLARRYKSAQATLYSWGPPGKGHSSPGPFSAHVYCD